MNEIKGHLKSAAEREAARKAMEDYQMAEDFKNETYQKDLATLMQAPEGRRLFRRLLGPEFTNYWGHNCDARLVGCELARVLEESHKGSMHMLFDKQEDDENGWNRNRNQ